MLRWHKMSLKCFMTRMERFSEKSPIQHHRVFEPNEAAGEKKKMDNVIDVPPSSLGGKRFLIDGSEEIEAYIMSRKLTWQLKIHHE